MSKILKNQTGSPITISDVGGVIIPASPATYTIPVKMYDIWAASSDILAYLGGLSPDVIISDGSVDLNPSDGVDLLKGLYPKLKVNSFEIEHIVTHATPNIETSHTFPSGAKEVVIVNTGNVIVKYAFQAGTSGTIYARLFPNAPLSLSEHILGSDVTVYLQAPVASVLVEAMVAT